MNYIESYKALIALLISLGDMQTAKELEQKLRKFITFVQYNKSDCKYKHVT